MDPRLRLLLVELVSEDDDGMIVFPFQRTEVLVLKLAWVKGSDGRRVDAPQELAFSVV